MCYTNDSHLFFKLYEITCTYLSYGYKSPTSPPTDDDVDQSILLISQFPILKKAKIRIKIIRISGELRRLVVVARSIKILKKLISTFTIQFSTDHYI